MGRASWIWKKKFRSFSSDCCILLCAIDSYETHGSVFEHDEKKQDVINKRLSEDIVLDINKTGKVIGIEIIDASKHINLERLLPVKYEVSKIAV